MAMNKKITVANTNINGTIHQQMWSINLEVDKDNIDLSQMQTLVPLIQIQNGKEAQTLIFF